MARLILKSPYLKPGGKKSPGGYLKYIATREGVEMAKDTSCHLPATAEQQQRITKLLKQYIPDFILGQCDSLHRTAQSASQKSFQLFDDGQLFLYPFATAAEAGYRRQDLIHIGAGGFQNTIPESYVHEFSGFLRFQLFCLNQLGNVRFPLFPDKF